MPSLRERDDLPGAAVANALGNLTRSRGHFELGGEWLEDALTIRRAMGDRRATGMTLGGTSVLAGRAGHLRRGAGRSSARWPSSPKPRTGPAGPECSSTSAASS
jgi:hypothetical protein